MNDAPKSQTLTGRGGAGRGQGRKPVAPDTHPYKLLLTPEQRGKLDALGGASWVRDRIDLAIHLDSLNLENAVNLSSRYIAALRQLPQFHLNINHTGPLTHIPTGAQILPTGDLSDEEDDSETLQIVYPGGHRVEVIAGRYFDLALAEASHIEVTTSPDDLGISERKQSNVQLRVTDLREHLQRKHRLA